MVDGATSEWILNVSDVPQGSVLGPRLFILDISELFELVETRLYAYANDSHYRQLFASQQTYVLLVPILTGTWLGFRSDVITGA